MPHQTPAPGTQMVRFRGDIIEFSLSPPEGLEGRAWLRTTIGHAGTRRHEVIAHVEDGSPVLARDWHDIPMTRGGEGRYAVRLPLLETGCFQAKTFLLPEGQAEPVWPPGGNVCIKVQPTEFACANSIYTVFTRQFRPDETHEQDLAQQEAVRNLDALGYSVIPRSGTFRDVIRRLDEIVSGLGFRIIQLLPIHPTPTTYARMGRFGSPFAAIDFMDVDPALAEFDRRSTPLDQFRELVDAVHARGAKMFLDIPVNHTGWASSLQIHHPEWFERTADDTFRSPGAWGVTWEDLSKLDYGRRHLWQYVARIFLFWCARGVDGFRCDAGYMVPFDVWCYVVAKVREQFPDTIFMLEGLGGKIEVTESLLGSAGLDWAYSEIFQQYDRGALEAYLPGTFRISREKGTLISFAETHDNNRLAATSGTYARMRTALCALCSESGGFGITNGVEWFADDKVDVHGALPLKWGNERNQVAWLRRLNAILRTHPACQASVPVEIVPQGGAALVLRRGDDDPLLVCVNLDCDNETTAAWSERMAFAGDCVDLLSGQQVDLIRSGDRVECVLAPGQGRCLSPLENSLRAVEEAEGEGPEPDAMRRQVLRAKALEVQVSRTNIADAGSFDGDELARQLADDPRGFCEGVAGGIPCVTTWHWPRDTRRVVIVPPGDFLLLRAASRFQVELRRGDAIVRHDHSMQLSEGGWFALLMPTRAPEAPERAWLSVTVYEEDGARDTEAPLLLLSDAKTAMVRRSFSREELSSQGIYGLLTNGRGGMVQAMGAWGQLQSQYDALLAANLHPSVPVDRQVLLRRCRAWLVYRGYSQEINAECLSSFDADPSRLVWQMSVPAGLGRLVPIRISASFEQGANRVALAIERQQDDGEQRLADGSPVRLIIRPDIEDRNMHTVTKAYSGAESSWASAVSPLDDGVSFSPYGGHRLQMRLPGGTFVTEPEWLYMQAHPFEQARGLEPSGDLFSPGYFSCELRAGETTCLTVAAVTDDDPDSGASRPDAPATPRDATRPLIEATRDALHAFVVRRGKLKTVIAGYPWFLDWGRDTLICLRGMIAAGLHDEAADSLRAFGSLERSGTLPNMLSGDDDTNRDTSDAPLWFVVACRDLHAAAPERDVLQLDCAGRPLKDVLASIARGYMSGTPNGICMDDETGLVFSPGHYTWMDTHHPAGTPRAGYPIEIQALWYAALAFLAEIDGGGTPWRSLSEQVRQSVGDLFVLPGMPYLSDCLHAATQGGARDAVADDALRPNQLFAITLGLVDDRELAAGMLHACEELLVPGAIRSLANRPVRVPIEVRRDGQLLNDPHNPYWGHYAGDEDTRRKPAYHNGTAWSWPFPSFAEALLMTFGAAARVRARAILSSSVNLVDRDCAGHVPEICDGDVPHVSRGCGAQAWGATELYRVLALAGGLQV